MSKAEGKSPAFQFYPNNFLGSGKVGMMNAEEIGIYLLLLCLDWNEDGFTFDEESLSRWCRVRPSTFRKAWKRVGPCFDRCEDGKLRNPRLVSERAKQAEWLEKSRRGGIAGAKARWGDGKDGSTKAKPKDRGGHGLVATKPITNASPTDDIESESESEIKERTTPRAQQPREGLDGGATKPDTSPPPRDDADPSATKGFPRRARNTPDDGPRFSLAPYLDAHRERFPGSDPPAGRYGKVFKRLEGKHGAAETLRRWKNCLARKGTFATPEELAAHWPEYDANDAPDPWRHLAGYPDIVDNDGVLTEYGERVTRPEPPVRLVG